MTCAQIIDGDLESYFETAPFESYPIYRGKAIANGKKSSVKEAGRMKVCNCCESSSLDRDCVDDASTRMLG